MTSSFFVWNTEYMDPNQSSQQPTPEQVVEQIQKQIEPTDPSGPKIVSQEEVTHGISVTTLVNALAGFGIVAIGLVAIIILWPKSKPVSTISQTPTIIPQVTLTAQYSNPFDQSTQYTNPFDTQNPFDNLQQ